MQARLKGKPVEDLVCVEIFCGTGRLTCEIRKLGLASSVGVDASIHSKVVAATLKIDLLKPGADELFDQFFVNPNVVYIHFAPPCGTASRARCIQRKGRYNPPVTRSEAFPDGVQTLEGTLLARVKAANLLYRKTSAWVAKAYSLGIMTSVENPGRSFMWLTSHYRKCIDKLPLWRTFFHHCCYGGQRAKLTQLHHSVPELCNLSLTCPGESQTHVHLPWGRSGNTWATSEETAYPIPLCQVWASLICRQLVDFGAVKPVSCVAEMSESNPHISARVALGLQPRGRKVPPLVPEFRCVVQLQGPNHQIPSGKLEQDFPMPPAVNSVPPIAILPVGSRRLRAGESGGIRQDEDSSSDRSPPVQTGCANDPNNVALVKFGIPWTPDEFVQVASSAKHPKDLINGVPSVLREAVSTIAAKGVAWVSAHRVEQMRRWVDRARVLEEAETLAREKLPGHCQKVLRHKRLCLFEEMLVASKYSDAKIANEMGQGFSIGGHIPASPAFRKKLTGATLAVSDLRKMAPVVRKGILRSAQSSGDPDLDKAVYDSTEEELRKGWLWGPVAESSLSNTSSVTRRFGVWQGEKCRPIDNFKESCLNATASSEDTITIHTADCVAAAISYRLHELGEDNPRRVLAAKAWDLRKAYKQLPVNEDSLRDSYLCVYDPDAKQTKIFGQFVMPFGARASVHAFCRVASGIWHIAVATFLVHWSVYFDDYICVEESLLCSQTERMVELYFQLLGWEVSAEKESSFDSAAVALGLKFNLAETRLGILLVENTEKRRRELCGAIDTVLETGVLSAGDGASLRGRLIFAENQIFGHSGRLHLRVLSEHIISGKKTVDASLGEALRGLKMGLCGNKPKRITTRVHQTWHIYVDASFEGGSDMPGGIGGVLILPDFGPVSVFSEQMELKQAMALAREGSKNPIYELECFAMFCGLKLWIPTLESCHVIVFTDNNGSLASMISGKSVNPLGQRLVDNTLAILDAGNVVCWFERVNTASNIADKPSRGDDDLTGLGERMRLDISNLISEATMPILQGGEEGASGMSHVA